MKHALGVLGVIAAGVLLLVSGAMNWRFGYQLGASELDSQILGLASAASDGLKALIPFFIFAAFRNRQWSHAIAGCALWAVCLSYSLTSALGFAALNRAETTGVKQVQATAYEDVRTELKTAREQLAWVPEHRPAATVAAEIEAHKQNRRWSSTNGCSDATASKSRDFCEQFHRLEAEMAAAESADKLSARTEALVAALAAMPAQTVKAEADPQARVLAELSGQQQKLVQTALVILVAVLVELGSALGFYVVFSQWNIYGTAMAMPRISRPANANTTPRTVEMPKAMPELPAVAASNASKLVAPQTDVERFFHERIVSADGSSLTATTLYEDYCDWCEEMGKEPMALPTFGRQFGDLGVQKAKIAGRIRYLEIALKSEADADGGRDLATVAA